MDAEDEGEGSFRDFSSTLSLKKDHRSRPLWVTSDGLIILEAFSPIYLQAYDFLVAISEPVSRPEFIHKYKLTPNSLYAAVAVSIETESIIEVLGRLCKTELPLSVVKFIRQCTSRSGKAKIVLKDNRYYVESSHPEVLRELLQYDTIANARAEEQETSVDTAKAKGEFLTTSAPMEMRQNLEYMKLGRSIRGGADGAGGAAGDGGIDGDGEEDDDSDLDEDVIAGTVPGQTLRKVSFMIKQECVQAVKRCALRQAHYPLMEEYDFRHDTKNPSMPSFDLRPTTRIRSYQEKSLSKMFGNERARSGIIVLPCGAGKSLTGVTAACTIKKSTIILCINNVSVEQWKQQFLQWTTLTENYIKKFTADDKDPLPPAHEPCIVLTTYSMICFGGKRADAAIPIIEAIRGREWGLMVLDEVHVTPASTFRTVLDLVNAHCKLGLTATLVREDDQIEDLHFLIGPKLYEANWMDLTQQGYLANVQCAEVWCPMTAEFYREYLKKEHSMRRRQLLYILNPVKFRVCEHLVHVHEDRGDKIIIFSDDIVALELYCKALKRPFIHGQTPEHERTSILVAFKTHPQLNCIGLSRVGDTALDIPEANVVIQVSSHFGARRQEAQRLGRILRPKQNQGGEFNAFFYTLVSTDTREMFFSAKRQQYLVDQGYTFKVLEDLAKTVEERTAGGLSKSKLLGTKNQELQLLSRVLSVDTKATDEGEDKAIKRSTEGSLAIHNVSADGAGTHLAHLAAGSARESTHTNVLLIHSQPGALRAKSSSFLSGAKRKSSTLGGLSGVDGTSYLEFETNKK